MARRREEVERVAENSPAKRSIAANLPSRPRALAPSRLIFSDVDGTFLTDDGKVPFDRAFLNHVRERYRVVFASSRTAEELQRLQRQLGWSGPFIAEDGHVLGLGDGKVEILGLKQEAIIARLSPADSWREISSLLALHPEGTRWRLASLLLPRAVAEATQYRHVRSDIAAADLTLTVGGDWSVLGSGSSKAAAARRLMELEQLDTRTIAAIGNEANDEALLRTFPRSFVIRNPIGHHPRLAAILGATRCHGDGPAGWLEMIDALDRDADLRAEAD